MNDEPAKAEPDDAGGVPSPPGNSGSLWMLRGLVLVALLLACYLAWVSLSHGRAVGCGGPNGGCESVLNSRWAFVAGLPVSLPAVSVFSTLLAALAFSGPKTPAAPRKLAHLAAMLLGFAAGSSALWFIALQAFVLEARCWYCLATHLCSLLILAGLLFARRLSLPALGVCGVAGLALTGAMATAQIVLEPEQNYELRIAEPDHALATLRVAWSNTATDDPGEAPSDGAFTMLAGEVEIDTSGTPVLGQRDAPCVLAVLFDYSCSHCRDLHRQFAEISQRNPGSLALIPLPMPQHPDCNPLVDLESASGDDACELARLALAVWQARPQAFAEFDSWLLSEQDPPTAAKARAEAVRLVGEAPLAAALSSDGPDRQIAVLVEIAERSPAMVVPQIHQGDKVLSGSFENSAQLERLLRADFGL